MPACFTLQRKLKNTEVFPIISWYVLTSGWRGYYSICGLSVDAWSQMCSLYHCSWRDSCYGFNRAGSPHPGPAALAKLNCNELINPGYCSRFRHLLSEGGDYSSTYGYSYIILYGCCCRNVTTSSKMTSTLHVTFLLIAYYMFAILFLIHMIKPSMQDGSLE